MFRSEVSKENSSNFQANGSEFTKCRSRKIWKIHGVEKGIEQNVLGIQRYLELRIEEHCSNLKQPLEEQLQEQKDELGDMKQKLDANIADVDKLKTRLEDAFLCTW